MNNLFWKAATAVSTAVAVCYLVINFELKKEVQQLQEVQKASNYMLGELYLHDDVFFLDVLMEQDPFWTVSDYYQNKGLDWYDVCGIRGTLEEIEPLEY